MNKLLCSYTWSQNLIIYLRKASVPAIQFITNLMKIFYCFLYPRQHCRYSFSFLVTGKTFKNNTKHQFKHSYQMEKKILKVQKQDSMFLLHFLGSELGNNIKFLTIFIICVIELKGGTVAKHCFASHVMGQNIFSQSL